MNKVIIGFIRLYQIMVSPMIRGRCRFYPSCSEFFIEALRKHGVLQGVKLGFRRLIKCRPFGASGFDPVP